MNKIYGFASAFILILLQSLACSQRVSNAGSGQVFVLLINANSQNEGIYTIEKDGVQEVLIFEVRSDAEVYNSELKKLDFEGLTVQKIDRWEVETFCNTENYKCTIYDQEIKPLPPKENRDNPFN